MWVCGEIGYAATTSGRQWVTVSATAREPSSCLSMSGLGGGDVALCGGAAEALADRGVEGLDGHRTCLARERSEQRRARHGTAEVLPRQVGGRHVDDAERHVAQIELARRVDQ